MIEVERQRQLSQGLGVGCPISFDGGPENQVWETEADEELKMRMLLGNMLVRSLFGVVHELLGGRESGALRQ